MYVNYSRAVLFAILRWRNVIIPRLQLNLYWEVFPRPCLRQIRLPHWSSRFHEQGQTHQIVKTLTLPPCLLTKLVNMKQELGEMGFGSSLTVLL